MIKKFLLPATAAMIVLIAPAAEATPSINVTICHATASETNPYTVNTVDTSSIDELNNQYLNGHGDHEGDIVPPFESPLGNVFAGKNWDAVGQATWNNGCVRTEPSPSPSPTPTPTPTPTVDPTPTPSVETVTAAAPVLVTAAAPATIAKPAPAKVNAPARATLPASVPAGEGMNNNINIILLIMFIAATIAAITGLRIIKN